MTESDCLPGSLGDINGEPSRSVLSAGANRTFLGAFGLTQVGNVSILSCNRASSLLMDCLQITADKCKGASLIPRILRDLILSQRLRTETAEIPTTTSRLALPTSRLC